MARKVEIRLSRLRSYMSSLIPCINQTYSVVRFSKYMSSKLFGLIFFNRTLYFFENLNFLERAIITISLITKCYFLLRIKLTCSLTKTSSYIHNIKGFCTISSFINNTIFESKNNNNNNNKAKNFITNDLLLKTTIHNNQSLCYCLFSIFFC